jgi:hypothetical protein
MEKRISIHNIPEISAIYFALLQCGYDYYSFEKSNDLKETIENFRKEKTDCMVSFFAKIKQNTCDVYPYWPRAAALEKATFFIDCSSIQFKDFDVYQNDIMTASNISEAERNQDFWDWVKDFPSALASILNCNCFQDYLNWENKWVEEQNHIWKNDLNQIQQILDFCATHYASPIHNVSIVLNPIKCAYSADYHIHGNRFFFCSGAFRPESVIHEFLHPIARPFVKEAKDTIQRLHTRYPGIDESYYLSGDGDGRVNAFEEYIVRCLSADVLAGNLPLNLTSFVCEILSRFS